MTEHHLHVQRTARYHLLGDPAHARELWVVVHGYGQLARFFLNNFAGLEEGRCIVAPEGLSRFYIDAQHSRVGATWMTREDRLLEIADHVRYLDQLVETLCSSAKPGITIHALGFSQGVATVARWSMQGLTNLRRLVLWAGTLPPELDRAALEQWRTKHVDLVLGDQDEFADKEDLGAMVARMSAASVPHAAHTFAGGHKLEPALLGRLINARPRP